MEVVRFQTPFRAPMLSYVRHMVRFRTVMLIMCIIIYLSQRRFMAMRLAKNSWSMRAVMV